MHEAICVVCGAKVIDKSPTKNKKFCSTKCMNRYYERTRIKPQESECQYNNGVLCACQRCATCGWNPKVEKARKEKIYGQVGE